MTLALTILATALLGAPQVPETAVFTLKATVEAAKPRLYLGDVATCSGTARLCDEAYGIDLGASPEPGKTLFLHADKLRAVLEKEWPEAAVTLDAAKPAKVTAEAAPVDEERIRRELQAKLDDALSKDETWSVTVEKLQVPTGLKLRPEEYLVEFPDLSETALDSADWIVKSLSGNHRVSVALRPANDEDGKVETFAASAVFKLSARVPVATRDLARGQIVGETDAEMQWVELERNAQRFVGKLPSVAGHRVKRPVAVGQAFPLNALEVPQIIRKGQLVRLEMSARGVSVSGRVEALGSGGYGEIIEAKYPATKKKLRVRIVDPSTVEAIL